MLQAFILKRYTVISDLILAGWSFSGSKLADGRFSVPLLMSALSWEKRKKESPSYFSHYLPHLNLVVW